MPVTIKDCNQEAERLWLQLGRNSKMPSKRELFSVIFNELDKVNKVCKINTVRTRKLKLANGQVKYTYRYEIYTNGEIIRRLNGRRSTKLYIFKLYIKHCPCPTHLKQLVNLSKIR
jgi:hypothetical protein